MAAAGAYGGGMGGMGASGGMGGMGGMGQAVSQYWKKHIADSVWLRIAIHLLAGLALLFQCLVILGCVPGSPGAGSSASGLFLLEFNAGGGSPGQTTRLRIGYIAMCAKIGDNTEHCTTTVGKADSASRRYLSTGSNDEDSFSKLPQDQVLNDILFNTAMGIQNNVLVVIPAIPGAFLATGVILLALYGMINRPWVGPASSWRQARRNRRLDIMRIVMIALIALSIVFSFAVAVAASQMFAAVQKATDHNTPSPSEFNVTRGGSALALHWLTVISTVGFFVGIIQTHIRISSVRISLTPEDTAGTSGGRQFATTGDSIQKASLLKDAEPMAINPASIAPQVPNGGTPSGAGGQSGGMGGGGAMRGGAMGMRGGPMGMRGAPMGMRGGAMGGGMRGGAMGGAMRGR